jgi:hypothetical protein
MKKASPFLALSCFCISLLQDGKSRILFTVSAVAWASTAVILRMKEHRHES